MDAVSSLNLGMSSTRINETQQADNRAVNYVGQEIQKNTKREKKQPLNQKKVLVQQLKGFAWELRPLIVQDRSA